MKVDSAYDAPVTFSAGTGTASLRLSAASTVTAGRGATTVVESRKASVVYHFVAGNGGGSTTITGFDPGSDRLVWVASPGQSPAAGRLPIASQAVTGKDLRVTLTDGSVIVLIGVSRPL